jgi:hypothetical protein
MRSPSKFFATVFFLFSLVGFARAASQVDYTGLDISRYGISPVVPHRDEGSPFLIGGTNPTSVIRALKQLNHIPIGDLEDRMRPGHASTDGFIGDNEKLLDVLASDNDTVLEKLGVTHAELAKHLHAMGVIARQLKENTGELLYHGRRYLVIRAQTHGGQASPFDDGTSGDLNIVVANLDSGKKISYSVLLPYMIERYGFYEGKESNYRLEPVDVYGVFDFIPAKSKSGHVTAH